MSKITRRDLLVASMVLALPSLSVADMLDWQPRCVECSSPICRGTRAAARNLPEETLCVRCLCNLLPDDAEFMEMLYEII